MKTKILILIGILSVVVFLLIGVFLLISNLNISEQIKNNKNIKNVNVTEIIEVVANDTINITANITTIDNVTINNTTHSINNKTYAINISIKPNITNASTTINKTNITNAFEIPQIRKTIIKDIDAKDAYKLINENLGNENFIIIDIRTSWEFKSGHIKGAINIDYYADDFVEQIKKLNKSKTYLVYCRSGGRSKSSLQIFQELNFEQIYHLVEGIDSWKSEGFYVE